MFLLFVCQKQEVKVGVQKSKFDNVRSVIFINEQFATGRKRCYTSFCSFRYFKSGI